jgi:hypothetical protein
MSQMDIQITTQVRTIEQSSHPKDRKYQLLDELYLWVMREHPDGLGAAVLDAIDAAQVRVLYPVSVPGG